MFHPDPETNKASIAALFKGTLAHAIDRLLLYSKWKGKFQYDLHLLKLHETNPKQYEQLVARREKDVSEQQYRIDVIKEIMRRKR